VSESIHGRFTFADFRLHNGEVLPEVTIAYVTRGRLAPDGRNAVLVTHGYTSGPRMIEAGVGSSEGAWSTLVGPGAPIDTDSCFVVCSNMLGSSYGSTNAASPDPRTGRPYGSRFPHITLTDIVSAQHRLLEHLGVRHLRAVVGPSYGGFQAFQWAVTFPNDMEASCRWCPRRGRPDGTEWRCCLPASSAIRTGMAATITVRRACTRQCCRCGSKR
jgi:homoserine O-acetyltransferase/O-succinyltransferase